jgi:hypothetical protein
MSSYQSSRAEGNRSISNLATTIGVQTRQHERTHKSCSNIFENQTPLSTPQSRPSSSVITERPRSESHPNSKNAVDLATRPVTPRFEPSILSQRRNRLLLPANSSFDSISSDDSEVFDVSQPRSSAGTPNSIYSDGEGSFPALPGSSRTSPKITVDDRHRKNSGYTAEESSPTKAAHNRRVNRKQIGPKGVRDIHPSNQGPVFSTSRVGRPQVAPGADSAQETFADFCDLFGRLSLSDKSSSGVAPTDDGSTSTALVATRKLDNSSPPLSEYSHTQPKRPAQPDRRSSPSAGGTSTEAYPHFQPFGTREEYTQADINLSIHKCLIDKHLAKKLSKKKSGWIYVLESSLDHTKGYVKIGETETTIKQRSEEWRKCGLNTKRVRESDEEAFLHSTLVEKLVHAELYRERRIFRCKVCGTKEKRRVHREWFEIEKETAFKHIENWRQWMKECRPFDELGNMDPYWRWEIDQLTRNASSVDWNEWTKPGRYRNVRYRYHQVRVAYGSMSILLQTIGVWAIILFVITMIYLFSGVVSALTAALPVVLYCHFYAVIQKEDIQGRKRGRI